MNIPIQRAPEMQELKRFSLTSFIVEIGAASSVIKELVLEVT
jgi:hypothetical protein